VRHLVYVAGFQLDVGESVLGLADSGAPPWWVVDGEVVTPGRPYDVLYDDMPQAHARRAVGKLQPFSVASFNQPVTAAAWHVAPSTYIICDRDRAVPVQSQETPTTRATYVRRLSTGHSPLLAAPGQLTKVIIESATYG
jgi:hypothetical protein